MNWQSYDHGLHLQPSYEAKHRVLANLQPPPANERTFLGMLHTSLSLAFLGTVVTQMLRLDHAPSTNPVFGFYVLGVPLACICISSAILTALLACVRFMRQQNAVVRRKCLAGGWEMYWAGGLTSMVSRPTTIWQRKRRRLSPVPPRNRLCYCRSCSCCLLISRKGRHAGSGLRVLGTEPVPLPLAGQVHSGTS